MGQPAGPHGYADLLEALRNPRHPDHETKAEWVGLGVDPASFDLENVNDGLARLTAPPSHSVTRKQTRRRRK